MFETSVQLRWTSWSQPLTVSLKLYCLFSSDDKKQKPPTTFLLEQKTNRKEGKKNKPRSFHSSAACRQGASEFTERQQRRRKPAETFHHICTARLQTKSINAKEVSALTAFLVLRSISPHYEKKKKQTRRLTCATVWLNA